MIDQDAVDHAGGQPPQPASRPPSRRSLLRGAFGAGAALGAPALLSGCGSASAKSETLKFWNFYGPQQQDDPTVQAQSDWFVHVAEEWNRTHERKVELVFIPGPAYLGGSKLPTAFAAGSGPDIFLLSPGDFLRYYNGGVLADISAHMSKEALGDYFPDALATRSDNGRVYALPMEIEPLAMFYSPKEWEKVGLSEGDVPTTWDEMLTVGEKLQAPKRAGLVFETNADYYQNFTWYPWLWQGGGDVIEGREVVFDSEAARQALKLWQDAVQSGVAPRTLPAAGDVPTAIRNGMAGMWQSGIWNVAAFKGVDPDFEYGVFKLPIPEGGKDRTDLGGWAFAANAQGVDPEAAAQFCAFALGSMEQDCIDRMVNWCTVAKSDIAPRKSVLEAGTESGGYDHPAMKKFKDEIFPTGRSEPRYPPVIYKSVSDAIQGCMLAGRNVDTQVEQSVQAIDAYMKTYQGAKLI